VAVVEAQTAPEAASDPAPAVAEPTASKAPVTGETEEGTDATSVPDGGSAVSAASGSDDSGLTADPESDAEAGIPTSSDGDNSPEDAAAPQVVNDANGQHVVMPDGSKVYTRHSSLPVTNAEQAQFELTHSGDQLRYPYKPGDKEYSANSDPAIPDSHTARMVETEILSFAERVVQDASAQVSPMWNSFKGIFQSELERAIKTGVGDGKIVEV
jgi:hypothetical protein